VALARAAGVPCFGNPPGEQLSDLAHGQEQPQRGLLERVKVEMPMETLGSRVLRIHDHGHGGDLLRRLEAAAQGVHEKELPDTLTAH